MLVGMKKRKDVICASGSLELNWVTPYTPTRTHTHTLLSFSLLIRQCGVDVLCRISLRMPKVVSNRSLTQFDVSGKDIYYLTKFSLCGREGSVPLRGVVWP